MFQYHELRCLISLATQLFVQKHMETNNKEINKFLSCITGFGAPMDSLHKGAVSEFNILSWTADSKVHVVHISRVIIAYTLESLSSLI